MTKYYTLPEVVAMLNERYDDVYYVVRIAHNKVATPRCIGKAMLFTDKHIETLREYFAKRRGVMV